MKNLELDVTLTLATLLVETKLLRNVHFSNIWVWKFRFLSDILQTFKYAEAIDDVLYHIFPSEHSFRSISLKTSQNIFSAVFLVNLFLMSSGENLLSVLFQNSAKPVNHISAIILLKLLVDM